MVAGGLYPLFPGGAERAGTQAQITAFGGLAAGDAEQLRLTRAADAWWSATATIGPAPW
ncbi:hypothetical protein [Streptomyces sp. BE133]|uniref:hypothetical protein n=1 Tax=Streptomyces sp. BE133 TaxID=3002523 RepID=UPI003FA7D187